VLGAYLIVTRLSICMAASGVKPQERGLWFNSGAAMRAFTHAMLQWLQYRCSSDKIPLWVLGYYAHGELWWRKSIMLHRETLCKSGARATMQNVLFYWERFGMVGVFGVVTEHILWKFCEVLRYAQVLRYLKLRCLWFSPVFRVFRGAGVDVDSTCLNAVLWLTFAGTKFYLVLAC
jgi:hypothetical protein